MLSHREGAVRRAGTGRGGAEATRGQALQTGATVGSDKGAASTGSGLTPVVNGTADTAWSPGGQWCSTGSPGAEETSLIGGPRYSNFLTRK
jgi:hypothetical protein